MTWLWVCPIVAFVLALLTWLAMSALMSSGTRYVSFAAELADGLPVLGALFLIFLGVAVAIHWGWRLAVWLFGG